MLRAPICKMSLYFATSSKFASSITSVMTCISNSSAAWRMYFSPSSSSPWKAYGDVLGLNAPPRKIVAPPALAIRAHSRI